MSKIKLPDEPADALWDIAMYLNSATMMKSRAVVRDGEIVGYWQTPEWLEGLQEIVAEIQRIVPEPTR